MKNDLYADGESTIVKIHNCKQSPNTITDKSGIQYGSELRLG